MEMWLNGRRGSGSQPQAKGRGSQGCLPWAEGRGQDWESGCQASNWAAGLGTSPPPLGGMRYDHLCLPSHGMVGVSVSR